MANTIKKTNRLKLNQKAISGHYSMKAWGILQEHNTNVYLSGALNDKLHDTLTEFLITTYFAGRKESEYEMLDR